MKVEEADRLGAQRAQALLDLGPEHFGATLTRAAVAALRSHEHVLGGALERLSDCALALPRRVEVRGVDVAHARNHGLADEAHVPWCGREAIGSETDAGHVDAGESEGIHAAEG